MKSFSHSLWQEAERQLQEIHATLSDPLSYSAAAVKTLVTILERLKTFTAAYVFSHPREEILFFREIKPKFVSKLLYYNELYNLEISKPLLSEKAARQYYKSQLSQLKSFYAENLELYKYYRSNKTHLDKLYFTRRKSLSPTCLDSSYFQSDRLFSTSHDYTWARLMASEEIARFLHKQLTLGSAQLQKHSAVWTAPKVSLVELIYALHAQGVINNGSLGLGETVALFETLFGVSLKQYHKTFLEIRERKSDRARFLQSLTQTFIDRMDQADK